MTDARISQISALIMPQLVIDENPSSQAGEDSVLAGRKMVHSAICDEDPSNKLLIITLEPTELETGYSAHSVTRFAERMCCLGRQWQREGVKVKPVLEIDLSKFLELTSRVVTSQQRDALLSRDITSTTRSSEASVFNRAIMKTRAMLCEISRMDLSMAISLDDPLLPQYFSDLVTWSCIKEENIESQLHRQLASAMSMPLAFIPHSMVSGPGKTLDACLSAKGEHTFFSMTKEGAASLVTSSGNEECHAVVPWGEHQLISHLRSKFLDKKVCTRFIVQVPLNQFSSNDTALRDLIESDDVAGLRVIVSNSLDDDPLIMFNQIPQLFDTPQSDNRKRLRTCSGEVSTSH
eukprot:GHVH01000792.1.p1 GENE.GHVH01000792.1~~GHVH01000792.1.p1  ORF type:complete len:349 (+),score=50.51 GHVH01000792.1:41-1087(+)